MATVTNLDPAAAKSRIDAAQATLLDVREPDEHARERIPGARLAPLSALPPARDLPPGPVIVHCKSGGRSAKAAQQLAASGCEVYNLAGGLDAWRAAGLPVVVDRTAPIPIMRQVQIIAGGTVLLSSIAAALVSPYFLLLAGFFGAGLLFAGVTGWCGMARVLSLMPWNRRGGAGAGCDGGRC